MDSSNISVPVSLFVTIQIHLYLSNVYEFCTGNLQKHKLRIHSSEFILNMSMLIMSIYIRT
jgi:hypothetical protein